MIGNDPLQSRVEIVVSVVLFGKGRGWTIELTHREGTIHRLEFQSCIVLVNYYWLYVTSIVQHCISHSSHRS